MGIRLMQFTQSIITSYENHASERESNAPDEFRAQERHEFLEYLRREKRDNILEIGCGPGHDAKFFQECGFRIVAVDNTPTMVRLTKEKGVRANVLDCYNIDQIAELFDAVYSVNCLLHIPQSDIKHILDLIAARLNHKGLMYLGLWGGEDFEGIWPQDKYEPKRFFSFRTPETLLRVIYQSFRIEYYRRIEPRDGVFFNSIIARKR